MKSCHTLIHSGCGGIIANKEIQFALYEVFASHFVQRRAAPHIQSFIIGVIYFGNRKAAKKKSDSFTLKVQSFYLYRLTLRTNRF